VAKSSRGGDSNLAGIIAFDRVSFAEEGEDRLGKGLHVERLRQDGVGSDLGGGHQGTPWFIWSWPAEMARILTPADASRIRLIPPIPPMPSIKPTFPR
jgi:hypothetical protein